MHFTNIRCMRHTYSMHIAYSYIHSSFTFNTHSINTPWTFHAYSIIFRTSSMYISYYFIFKFCLPYITLDHAVTCTEMSATLRACYEFVHPHARQVRIFLLPWHRVVRSIWPGSHPSEAKKKTCKPGTACWAVSPLNIKVFPACPLLGAT